MFILSSLFKVYTIVTLIDKDSSPAADFVGFSLCHFLYFVLFFWLSLA